MAAIGVVLHVFACSDAGSVGASGGVDASDDVVMADESAVDASDDGVIADAIAVDASETAVEPPSSADAELAEATGGDDGSAAPDAGVAIPSADAESDAATAYVPVPTDFPTLTVPTDPAGQRAYAESGAGYADFTLTLQAISAEMSVLEAQQLPRATLFAQLATYLRTLPSVTAVAISPHGRHLMVRLRSGRTLGIVIDHLFGSASDATTRLKRDVLAGDSGDAGDAGPGGGGGPGAPDATTGDGGSGDVGEVSGSDPPGFDVDGYLVPYGTSVSLPRSKTVAVLADPTLYGDAANGRAFVANFFDTVGYSATEYAGTLRELEALAGGAGGQPLAALAWVSHGAEGQSGDTEAGIVGVQASIAIAQPVTDADGQTYDTSDFPNEEGAWARYQAQGPSGSEADPVIQEAWANGWLDAWVGAYVDASGHNIEQWHYAVTESFIVDNFQFDPASIAFVSTCDSDSLGSAFLNATAGGAGRFLGWDGAVATSAAILYPEKFFDFVLGTNRVAPIATPYEAPFPSDLTYEAGMVPKTITSTVEDDGSQVATLTLRRNPVFPNEVAFVPWLVYLDKIDEMAKTVEFGCICGSDPGIVTFEPTAPLTLPGSLRSSDATLLTADWTFDPSGGLPLLHGLPAKGGGAVFAEVHGIRSNGVPLTELHQHLLTSANIFGAGSTTYDLDFYVRLDARNVRFYPSQSLSQDNVYRHSDLLGWDAELRSTCSVTDTNAGMTTLPVVPYAAASTLTETVDPYCYATVEPKEQYSSISVNELASAPGDIVPGSDLVWSPWWLGSRSYALDSFFTAAGYEDTEQATDLKGNVSTFQLTVTWPDVANPPDDTTPR